MACAALAHALRTYFRTLSASQTFGLLLVAWPALRLPMLLLLNSNVVARQASLRAAWLKSGSPQTPFRER